jgi:hypothetical protein
MGFLKSSIQVRARYKRCHSQWSEHLGKTRSMILKAAHLATRRRKAVVFGAGLLHDIPLSELSDMFERVLLVDVVHTWPCRFKVLAFPNVELVTLDVTGIVGRLPAARRSPSIPLPESRPSAFIDDPLLDFSVSVNLLSQLPWVPGQFLADSHSEAALAAMKAQLIFAHLEYLRRLPGHTALISDTAWRSVTLKSAQGSREEEWDVLSGVSLPAPETAWDWLIAPAPERSKEADLVARVHAYPDWKGTLR